MDLGDSWQFIARFSDFETGAVMERPYNQRKSQQSIGGSDADRQRDQAYQIGVSKAIRNVVKNCLQSISTFAFEEAQKSLVGKIAKDVNGYRESTLKKLQQYVDVKRVEATVGRSAKEWTAADLAGIVEQMTAIHDKMLTWDEAFPTENPAVGQAAAETARGSNIEMFVKDEEKGDEGTDA
jgi:hypothetical protein